MDMLMLDLANAPGFGRRGGNSSIPKSPAKELDFRRRRIPMLALLCLLAYLLEFYVCFALLAYLVPLNKTRETSVDSGP